MMHAITRPGDDSENLGDRRNDIEPQSSTEVHNRSLGKIIKITETILIKTLSLNQPDTKQNQLLVLRIKCI